MIYLDNSATTRPCEAAMEAMHTAMAEEYFNPSALYSPAFEAEKKLKAARETVASRLGAKEKNVIFTSGGTESDNLAIFGLTKHLRPKGDILYTAAEHAAVKNACIAAAVQYGVRAREIPLLKNGSVNMEALSSMLDEQVMLICVMQVCNETGVIMPIGEVCRLRDRFAPKALIHVDGVQGFLRLPFSLKEYGISSYALSGHKLHAPKGIGALVLANGVRLSPILEGGGQQGNLRSGTENTPGIAGLAAAIEAYPAAAAEKIAVLKKRLLSQLSERLPEMLINGEGELAPHIANIAFPPVRAETLLHALEADGILIGTGSACSSKGGRHSSVLKAMGLNGSVMDSAIRISLCPSNTLEEMDKAAEAIIRNVEILRNFRRR